MTSENKENPLGKLIRQPKIYIKLPSNGRFSKDKINFTATQEVPVRALTARDNLLNKNPDALLNGDAVENAIKSCVPEIQNIKELPMNDIDAILVAIRYASAGDKLSYTIKCPKCGEETKVELSIRTILGAATEIPELNSVKFSEMIEDEEVEIEIVLKPYTFENQTRAVIADFDSQKRLNLISSMYKANIPDGVIDEEKLNKSNELDKIVKDQMREIFKNMADLTLSLVIDSITQINMVSKKTGTKIITEKEFIKEYIWAFGEEKYDVLKEKMKEVMSYGVNKKISIVCGNEKCQHAWEEEVGYDQSNFSGNTSLD